MPTSVIGPAAGSRFRPRQIAAAALFLATCVTYWPLIGHQFIFLDDAVYITDNVMVNRGLTLEGLRRMFTSASYASNWFPLTWLSHAVDVQLFGLAPGGHHLMSLLIHACSTLFLFRAACCMTGAVTRSFLLAALFSLHPLRVESVAWAAERKDVLGAFFWTLSLLCYVRWARRPGHGRFLAVLLTFALGLMSKPILVTLPFVLLLLDFWPLGRSSLLARSDSGAALPTRLSPSVLLLEKTPLFILAAAASLVTVVAQAESIRLAPARSLFAKLANASHSYCVYLGKTFWPADLQLFYPYSEEWLNPGQAAVSGLLLTVITLAATLRLRSRPYLGVGWFYYLGTLVPVIGLTQGWNQAMADRFTYLPQTGIFLAVLWLAFDLAPPRRRGVIVPAMLTAVTVLCSQVAITAKQLATMKDNESLYRHLLDADPGNQQLRYQLGLTLIRAGQTDEGLAQLRGVACRPTLALLAHYHLETAQQSSIDGDAQRALEYFTKALLLEPGNVVALREATRLGAAGVRMPEGVNARATPSDLLDDQEGRCLLGEANALADAGHYALALGYYRRAVLLQPDSADAKNNLGSCLAKLNLLREAAESFENALGVDPGHRQARDNLEQARRLLGP